MRAGSPQASEEQAGEEQAESPQAGEEQAGEEQAGEMRAGSPQAGEEQAGEMRAGSTQAGEMRAGGEQAGEEQAGEIVFDPLNWCKLTHSETIISNAGTTNTESENCVWNDLTQTCQNEDLTISKVSTYNEYGSPINGLT